jgi:hypothetical protein
MFGRVKEREEKDVRFGPCCFCGEQIDASEVDPCRVTVETSAAKWQVWFCHAECFKARLTDNPMFEPAHF